MKVVVVVQARLNSSRLPGKVMLPLAGEPMLGRQLERLQAVEQAHEICVATTAAPGDEPIRGLCRRHGVRVVSGPFEGRRLGTIAAMTENFCQTCNRLRVSATGQLHACLARDDTGDIRSALRSKDPDRAERLEAVVRAALGTKRDGHGFNLDGSGGPAKAMVSIGG